MVHHEKIKAPYHTKETCYGCSACAAICPVNAIKMLLDNDGFYYPSIERNSCISCNACVSICLANTRKL